MAVPISVVMPARNVRRFIREAIVSVCTQSLSVSELIIINDGSTDGTGLEADSVCRKLECDAEISPTPSFLVLHQDHRGISSARNVGIRLASQPWIAFLDADDVWSRNKIELQWSVIVRYPDVGVVSCAYSTFKDGGRVLPFFTSCLTNPSNSDIGEPGRFLPRIGPEFFTSGFVPLPSTVIVRREVIEEVGLFNEKLEAVEDFDCFMRILANYPLAIVERSLMGYRQHGTNTHRNLPLMEANLLEYCELVAANPQNYPPGASEAATRGLEWVRTCYGLDS